MSNLTFADDIALLADNKANLQRLVKITENYARRWRFSFNTKKSKVVVFIGKEPNQTYFWMENALRS